MPRISRNPIRTIRRRHAPSEHNYTRACTRIARVGESAWGIQPCGTRRLDRSANRYWMDIYAPRYRVCDASWHASHPIARAISYNWITCDDLCEASRNSNEFFTQTRSRDSCLHISNNAYRSHINGSLKGNTDNQLIGPTKLTGEEEEVEQFNRERTHARFRLHLVGTVGEFDFRFYRDYSSPGMEPREKRGFVKIPTARRQGSRPSGRLTVAESHRRRRGERALA